VVRSSPTDPRLRLPVSERGMNAYSAPRSGRVVDAARSAMVAEGEAGLGLDLSRGLSSALSGAFEWGLMASYATVFGRRRGAGRVERPICPFVITASLSVDARRCGPGSSRSD
jgi:hypothetical protein